MRRDREQVLRQPVVDLPSDTGPLFCNRSAELGEADGPPHTGEQDTVGKETQEVALRHVLVGDDGREDVVELREERERGSEAEPAVEVLTLTPEAQAEPDQSDEAE